MVLWPIRECVLFELFYKVCQTTSSGGLEEYDTGMWLYDNLSMPTLIREYYNKMKQTVYHYYGELLTHEIGSYNLIICYILNVWG